MSEHDQWLAALERITQQREQAERLKAWKIAKRRAEQRWRKMQDIRALMRPGQ